MQLNNMLPQYTREGDRHDTAEMAELDSVLSDKISSDRILNPYESLNSYDVNSNAPIISGYPMLSILQGEPICDVVSDSIMADHAAFGDSNTRVSRSAQPLIYENKDSSIYDCHSARLPEQIMGGTLLSASTLANLLASRSSSVHENSNDLVISAPAIFPSNSSFASPSNCSNAVLGDKWGFGNFLPSCELAGKSPEGMNFQPSDGNEWISANSNVVSDHLYGCSKFSSELSLGLATSQPCANRTSLPDHCAEMSCSGISNHSINGTGYGLDQTPGNSKEFYDTGRPCHFSQVIAGSKYLTVLQDILAEIAHYSLANPDQMRYNAAARRIFTANSDDFTDGDGSEDHQMVSAAQARVMEAKKSQLLGLLQMVDDQYNQCIDEVHMVISAFHAATEIDPQMHSRFALQTISCLYKNLRERISSHILGMGAHTRSTARDKDSIFESSFIQKQWALQQLRRKEHQLWKPQRGLPERSASVLRAWMFQNFLHPYPKDSEKHLLAIKSGLTRSQVSNWFINARVRLWKPMIEEMYAEMNRQKAHKNHREVSNTRGHTGIDIQRFRLA